MPIAFQELTPVLGAQILGDPRIPYTPEEVHELRDVFNKRRVLVFRGHELSAQDQLRICGYLDLVIEDTPGSTVGWVSTRSNQGRLGTGKLVFHSDISFCEHPFSGISLFAVDLVDGQSSTRFCRVSDPTEWLPNDLRQHVENAEIINIYPHPGRNNWNKVPPDTPMIRRPLIGQHPRTGEPVMWANDDYTDCIVGLDPAKSETLLEELFAAVYKPEHSYEHSWRVNDLVIWDNIAVHHARDDLSTVGTRTLRRVITGIASFDTQHPGYLKKNPWYGEKYLDEESLTQTA